MINLENGDKPIHPQAGYDDVTGENRGRWFGLSKREYFAGLAMQSYAGGEFTGQSGTPHKELAEWSVKMADALLKALETKTE